MESGIQITHHTTKPFPGRAIRRGERIDIMSIREQCNLLRFQIAGALIRHPELEQSRHEKYYLDEDGNEYYLRRGILTIVTAEGGVL